MTKKSTIVKDWTTKAGLRAIIVLYGGHHCGYVELPKDHPLVGVGYNDESPALEKLWKKVQEGEIGKRGVIPIFCSDGKARPAVVFDVHGSITFSGMLSYANNDNWWYGFDCLHDGDKSLDDESGYGVFHDGVFRDEVYVTEECENLARQVMEVTCLSKNYYRLKFASFFHRFTPKRTSKIQ